MATRFSGQSTGPSQRMVAAGLTGAGSGICSSGQQFCKLAAWASCCVETSAAEEQAASAETMPVVKISLVRNFAASRSYSYG